MICELSMSCLLYNDEMPMDSGIGAVYARKYCEGDKTICARYRVAMALGKDFVPIDLLPDMEGRADQILSEHNK